MNERGEIEVIVTNKNALAVIVVDKKTRRLLLLTQVYSRKLRPGVYTGPEEVVDVFMNIATKGHYYVPIDNPEVVFEVLKQMLEADIPDSEKIKQIKQYLRGVLREGRRWK